MAIIRNARKAHFTIVPNEGLRSDGLSLQAKGLLALMLSFPDDWQYNLKHLETLSTNGRDAHRAALNELIDAGYAVWRTVHKEDGTLAGRELVVSDTPLDHRAPEKPSDGSTVRLKNRPSGKPSVGKPAPTNTDLYEEPQNEDSSSGSSRTPEPQTARGEAEEPKPVPAEGSGSEPLDLTASDASVYRQGRGRGQTDSHLPTFHPEVFKQLVTFRKLHGPKATDEMFRAWAAKIRHHISDHGEARVLAALETAIGDFATLKYPFSFYEACVNRPTKPKGADAQLATSDDFTDTPTAAELLGTGRL